MHPSHPLCNHKIQLLSESYLALNLAKKMSGGGNNWKSFLVCFMSSIKLPNRNQVVSESVHGAEMAKKYLSNCNVCVEAEKGCKCKADDDLLMISANDAVDGGGGSQHHVNANSSFAHSVINMVGMLIGLGQLSTPYALQNGGWGSVFLLVGLGAACAYTTHLLGKCLKGKSKSRNYSDIGNHAFGTNGRLIATTFIYMEIFMALVSYTISLSDNLSRVFAGTHLKIHCFQLTTSQILTVIAVLVALPSLWLRDLSSISFLSSGGILMSILIFTTVALTAISGAVKANHSIPFLRFHNIPAISGLYIFSFAGHIVFPDIYKSMKDPSKFTQVSIVSFSIVTALYTSLAFMGATMFGAEVNSQITLSMPPHLVITKIALWATVLTPMTKYALEFAPIAMQLEHILPHNMTSKMRMLIRGSVGSMLLIGILGLALSVPYFEYVLGLTGSLVSVAICIIFPCAFYVKIHWSQISRSSLVLNVMLIVLGCLFGLFGTISSSKSLLESMQKGPKH